MNELHEKINQAKKNLGLNSSELSAALGYSKPYITKALIKLPGDKVQKRLIDEISWLLGENRASPVGESVKSIDTAEIIKQKDLKIAKRECELFWSTKAIKDKNHQIEKLQSKISNEQTKISNERILSVIIFAVTIALFLASHAI